ncbi:MAG: hypothetical protein NT151_11470 [Acidobacteria bacterium]|nr:hypothetical protein [Acidobacteriota bacterium]
MIDFDSIDEWAPDLSRALTSGIPTDLRQHLVRAAPTYIEDALDVTLAQAGRDAVIDLTLRWIESTTVAAYHGTRLTDSELASVRSEGLVPLVADARRNRLERALSRHPLWPQVCGRLPEALRKYGAGGTAGIREGQVHLTLSKTGLVHAFNHYLIGGSEFDQQVALDLLGEDGRALLGEDGTARVIQFAVPGPAAIQTTHPFFSVQMMRDRGEVPNLVGDLLASWSYKQVHPEFQSRRLETDCGLFFRATVPAAWISAIDTLNDSAFVPR